MIALVVQSDFIVTNTAPIALAARELKLPVIDISMGFLPERMPDFEGAPFVYGSVAFLRWAKDQPSLAAYLQWGETELSPATWAAELGDAFLNADGAECAAGDAPAGWHVRPIRNDKTFAGQISPVAAEFARVPAWASPPKPIETEARIFVVDGCAVSASLYREDGQQVRKAIDAKQIPLPAWLPFPNCVVDFAMTPEGWRVVEFNSIHTSGWYACDPAAVLAALMAEFKK